MRSKNGTDMRNLARKKMNKGKIYTLFLEIKSTYTRKQKIRAGFQRILKHFTKSLRSIKKLMLLVKIWSIN